MDHRSDNIGEVAVGAVKGMNFTWCGQSCGSTSRVFLHESMYEIVIEKMAEFDEGLAHVACATLSGELAKICHSAANEKMYRMRKPSLRYYVSDGEFEG